MRSYGGCYGLCLRIVGPVTPITLLEDPRGRRPRRVRHPPGLFPSIIGPAVSAFMCGASHKTLRLL
jgi:hypothetical protein